MTLMDILPPLQSSGLTEGDIFTHLTHSEESIRVWSLKTC